MIKEFLLGIFSYLQAVYYIKKLNLYKYLALLLLMLLFFMFPIVFFDVIVNFISAIIPFANTSKYADVSVSFASGISGFFLLILMSPVFSMISEEVMQKLAGKSYKFSFTQLLKDMIRGIKITLRNLLYEYVVIAVISIILYFLPHHDIISLSAKVLIFFISSYFYGFSLIDYTLENYRYNYKASVVFVRSHLGLAIGLGSIYYATISINDIQTVKSTLGHLSIYWSGFGEAFIALIGVIGAGVAIKQLRNK